MSLNHILKNDIRINEKNEVSIIREIERAEYLKIKNVLERYGGKYNKGKKNFSFPTNPKPLVDNFLNTGKLPEINPTAFFPTPKEIVETMMCVASFDNAYNLTEEYQRKIRVLEPSAGVGGIVDTLYEKAPHAQYDTIELLETNVEILESKGYSPINMDFLTYNCDYTEKYDYVMMNPPFKGTTYIKHVLHAIQMLKPNGSLAAVVPTSFLKCTTKLDNELCEMIALYGEIYMNKEKSFADLGTNVDTCVITINKGFDQWRNSEYQGYKNFYVWHTMLTLNNCNEFHIEIMKLLNKNNFKKDYDLLFRECINDFILKFKKERILISKKYMELYLHELKSDLVETYDDISFILENNTDEKGSSSTLLTIKNPSTYSEEQLQKFSKGALF